MDVRTDALADAWMYGCLDAQTHQSLDARKDARKGARMFARTFSQRDTYASGMHLISNEPKFVELFVKGRTIVYGLNVGIVSLFRIPSLQ